MASPPDQAATRHAPSAWPGAAEVPVEEEVRRVVPVIRALREAPKLSRWLGGREAGVEVTISVDTRKAEVARQAIEAGAVPRLAAAV